MKRVTLEQLPPEIATLLVACQQERVLVTRDGKPYALLVGIENKDEEDLQLEFSPEFWRMIEERRQDNTSVPLDEFMRELADKEKQAQVAAPAHP